jgi:DUF4097 and DUF4098 domain-containing protein YvlB
MKPAFACLLLITVAVSAPAQFRDNRETQLACNNIGRDRPLSCTVHETNLGASNTLDVESRNGGITVKGWAQNNILVRARLEAWAENDPEARLIASQIHIDTTAGRIRATGPEFDGSQSWDRGRRWAVSFEIFAPWNTDVKLSSHNGGITLADLRGHLEFQSHNGGVRLTRVAGDVAGETHNGGIDVELAGNSWDGRQLEVSTHNGGVTLGLPASYSARVEARSSRGRVDSDFPITVSGRVIERDLNFNIGSGGPLIKVSTNNGAIRLRKL